MKRLPLIIIGLLLLLTACGGASKRGSEAGEAFMAAWGDTAAMVLLADGRDSLTQAAHVIVLSPRELAQLKVPQMVELLRLRQFDTDSAADYLSLIHWLCDVVGHDRHAHVFDSTMQAVVNGLPLKEQMNVYVQSSRPAALGAALAADANEPGADMADINARIDVLRDLYTPADFSTFENAYKAGVKR